MVGTHMYPMSRFHLRRVIQYITMLKRIGIYFGMVSKGGLLAVRADYSKEAHLTAVSIRLYPLMIQQLQVLTNVKNVRHKNRYLTFISIKS